MTTTHPKERTESMTIDQRAWATELAEGWHGTESRAFTVHHPGQITLSQYETLDRVEPQELTTPQYLVRTGRRRDGWGTSDRSKAAGWSAQNCPTQT